MQAAKFKCFSIARRVLSKAQRFYPRPGQFADQTLASHFDPGMELVIGLTLLRGSDGENDDVADLLPTQQPAERDRPRQAFGRKGHQPRRPLHMSGQAMRLCGQRVR